MTEPLNEPQFIRTPNGDELVVLSRSHYEELLRMAAEAAEDAADVAAYDAAKTASLGAGLVPVEVSRQVQKGESILKALRSWRGIGQVELAQAIGTSQGFVSDLENRRRTLTASMAPRLARALDVPLNWLI